MQHPRRSATDPGGVTGRAVVLQALGGITAGALLFALAGCTAEKPSAHGCPAPLGDPIATQRQAVEADLAAAGSATTTAQDWLGSNEGLFVGMPEYAALQQAVGGAAAAQQALSAAGSRFPVLGALSCGRIDVYPDPGPLVGSLHGLDSAQHAAEAAAATIRQQWTDERSAQLAIAAGFTSQPAPVRFDVTAADPDDINAVLLAHHAASYTGLNYVLMRWSMGGRTFPGVGGLVRFTGSLAGLYRVTALLGQFSKDDDSTHSPFTRALDGLAFGAYDAAFQTSWNGSESSLRVWALMRVGD